MSHSTSRAFAVLAVAGVVLLMAAPTKSQESEGSKSVSSSQVSQSMDSKGAEKTPLKPNQYVPTEDSARSGFSGHIVDFVEDQKRIWTSPSRVRLSDANWLVPLGGIAAGLFAADREYSASLNQNPTTIKHYKSVSNYGIAGLVGGSAGLYFLSFPTHNERWRETGFLAGEAALNSLVTVEALKYSLRRSRPYQGNGSGAFFNGGTSFPSEHSAAAWSIASVFAHEYPGTIPKLFAYGAASAVSLSRVKSRQHFPSDVLVGSVIGYLIAQDVYRHRHNHEIGGAAWESPHEFVSDEKMRTPRFMGSPYVPLDSWVYPALDRLAAMGYIQSAYSGMRPWTRMECARLLEEAGVRLQSEESGNDGPQSMYDALRKEFAPEQERLEGADNVSANVDALYTRFTGISGPPLRDGYHFGQTIINDNGRPYGEGFNNITGVSAHAVAGSFAFSFQGEYQHAPDVPSASPFALQQIANADLTLPVSNSFAAVDRLQILGASVSFQFRNLNFSFGKQSLWLGSGDGGSLLLSNNAEPITMFRIDSASPYTIPGISRLLGPMRTEYFIGQLSGHKFEFDGGSGQLVGPGGVNPQPFLSGVKLSFKPTANIEMGFGMTAEFAGPGLPFTWHNYLRAFYSHTSGTNNPGKRISSADFSYRVPRLRDWLTIYADTLVVDEYSPIGSTRATVNPGIHVSQFPALRKLDLRAEGIHEPLTNEFSPGFVYYGLRRFRSGYTNNGNLLGSWIGRAGRGGQGWLTYWIAPRSRLQAGYRLQEVSKDYIGGGRSVDCSARADLEVISNVVASGSVQYEKWHFPVLSPIDHSDVSVSFQLTFFPRWNAHN